MFQVAEQGDDEEESYERMDTSGLEVLGLPTQFGGQRSRKVCIKLPAVLIVLSITHLTWATSALTCNA